MTALRVVDLYAGAGGASTGLREAAKSTGHGLRLTVVDTWQTALETHAANHPDAVHLHAAVSAVDPQAVAGDGLDLLLAGPPCTHHSLARGASPRDDLSRDEAWQIIRWCEAVPVRHVLVENVPAFTSWGPLDDRGYPIPECKGEYFHAWCHALRDLGYRVDWRVLNAADYGDVTTRERVFIWATRGRLAWPEPTHAEHPQPSLFGTPRPWRAAAEIIDWAWPAEPLIGRRRALSLRALERIRKGLRGEATAYTLGQHSGSVLRPASAPLATLTTDGGTALIFQATHGGRTSPVDGPLQTITGGQRGDMGLVQTISTKDRCGLDLSQLSFRMLQPHELAAAMVFPADYQWRGTKTARIKQIGNAWPVHLATALCRAILEAL